MSTFTSEPGAKLADRYRLEDRVRAAGGWAAWKAIDEILARPVTVLAFAPDFGRVAEVITAARAASRLTDPRLAQVFDVEEGDDRAYIVTEWVAGDSLGDLLGAGPLDPDHGVALITEASRALAGAHAAGLSHLCLTPASLVWTPGGGVKLLGLGIDAALAGVTSDDPGLADTRGLGRLLYATLTGLWPGDEITSLPPAPRQDGLPCSPRQARAGVPAAIDAVTCEALLQRPRRDKPPARTPAELAQALAEVGLPPGRPGTAPTAALDDRGLGGQDTFPWGQGDTVSRQPRARGGPPPGRRAITAGAVIGIAVVVLLAAVGVGGWLLSRHQAPSGGGHAHASSPPGHLMQNVLRPLSAVASDDPAQAPLAVDSSTSTFWHTDYYIGSPVFGNLKAGTGLVLDMGRQVSVSEVQVLFGTNAGADVQIKVSDAARAPSPAAAAPLRTVAQASDVGNLQTFRLKSAATARYVVIWLTRLPPQLGGTGNYQAEIYNVVVRGAG